MRRKMLYCFGIIIIYLLCLIQPSTAAITAVPNDAQIVDLTYIDHTMFFRTSDGDIYSYQLNDNSLNKIDSGYNSSDYGCLFSLDNSLYVITKDTYQFISVGNTSLSVS